MSKSPVAGSVVSRFEPPETLYVMYVGIVDGPNIRASRAETKPLLEQLSYHFLIFDVSQLGSLSADGRRATVERAPAGTSPLRGVAIVGATFHMRAIGMMLARASELLHGKVDNPVRFFDTPEDARAWLAHRRMVVSGG